MLHPAIRPASGAALFAGLWLSHALASETPIALDSPVLVVTSPGAPPRSFTLRQLTQQPSRTIRTATQWHHAQQDWQGVPIRLLLGPAVVHGGQVRVSALNDYAVDIRMSDIRQYDPILAYKVDGRFMPVRDKGPLVVIYPFDNQPALNLQRYYNQAVWQVDRLTVQ